MNKLERAILHHVFREENQVADALTKAGTMKTDYANTMLFVVLPMFVKK